MLSWKPGKQSTHSQPPYRPARTVFSDLFTKMCPQLKRNMNINILLLESKKRAPRATQVRQQVVSVADRTLPQEGNVENTLIVRAPTEENEGIGLFAKNTGQSWPPAACAKLASVDSKRTILHWIQLDFYHWNTNAIKFITDDKLMLLKIDFPSSFNSPCSVSAHIPFNETKMGFKKKVH